MVLVKGSEDDRSKQSGLLGSKAELRSEVHCTREKLDTLQVLDKGCIGILRECIRNMISKEVDIWDSVSHQWNTIFTELEDNFHRTNFFNKQNLLITLSSMLASILSDLQNTISTGSDRVNSHRGSGSGQS